MNETSQRTVIIRSVKDTILLPVAGTDLFAEVPQQLQVDVVGPELSATVTMTYDRAKAKMVVKQIDALRTTDPDGDLTTRLQRTLGQSGIVDDALRSSVRGGRMPDGSDWDEFVGTLPDSFFTQLARGRTKSQQSMLQTQAEVAAEYRKVKAERAAGVDGLDSDILTLVAKRLYMARATVGRYLETAGVTPTSHRRKS